MFAVESKAQGDQAVGESKDCPAYSLVKRFPSGPSVILAGACCQHVPVPGLSRVHPPLTRLPWLRSIQDAAEQGRQTGGHLLPMYLRRVYAGWPLRWPSIPITVINSSGQQPMDTSFLHSVANRPQ